VPDDRSSLPLSHRRVVVVDDDVIVQRVVSQALIHSGADVESCDDGAAALAAITRQVPDLVILDISMPVMGGLELLEKLRARAETADLPVVIHTGCAEHEYLEEARTLRAAAVLNKPTRPSEVVNTARQVLEGARPLLQSAR
jgi:CheY-like chemotaxis protein